MLYLQLSHISFDITVPMRLRRYATPNLNSMLKRLYFTNAMFAYVIFVSAVSFVN